MSTPWIPSLSPAVNKSLDVERSPSRSLLGARHTGVRARVRRSFRLDCPLSNLLILCPTPVRRKGSRGGSGRTGGWEPLPVQITVTGRTPPLPRLTVKGCPGPPLSRRTRGRPTGRLLGVSLDLSGVFRFVSRRPSSVDLGTRQTGTGTEPRPTLVFAGSGTVCSLGTVRDEDHGGRRTSPGSRLGRGVSGRGVTESLVHQDYPVSPQVQSRSSWESLVTEGREHLSPIDTGSLPFDDPFPVCRSALSSGYTGTQTEGSSLSSGKRVSH